MTNFVKIQTSFTGGESSPLVSGRVELKAYDTQLKTMQNFYSLVHGPAKFRTGTQFIDDIDATGNTRLIPFVYSRTLSYLLILTEGSIEFVHNKAFILSSPTVHYSIAHPYTSDELQEITYAQSGNALILCHPNHAPKVLQRTSDTNWTLTDIEFLYLALSDQAFENKYIRFTIITAGAANHTIGDVYTIQVFADGTYLMTPPGGSPTGDMVAIEVNQSAIIAQTWTITCVYDTASREEWTVVGSVSGSPPVQWGTSDYPKAVGFFEQRLYFAGSNTWPQRVWGSAVGDYFNLSPGAEDGDAVDFQIASNKFDQIIHLEATRQLLPFTHSDEISMSGPSGSTITPSAVSIRAHTSHGTNDVKPVKIGQEVLFVQRDGKKLRAVSYQLETDANEAPDLTILAEHITEDGITDMSFQQDPDAIMWLVRSDGVLLSLTHLRNQEITAWARHTTDGLFKNVCVVPEGSGDTSYVVVDRIINGATKRYVEYFTDDQHLDSCVVATSATPKTVWTGLAHLNGKVVTTIGDGFVMPTRTVSSGSITLPRAVSEVVIGLQYTGTLEMMHPEIPLTDGTSQGRQTRVYRMVTRFYNTIGATINDEVAPVLSFPTILDEEPELFSGDVETEPNTGWGFPLNMKIEQELPMPCIVLAAVLHCECND